MAFNGSFPAPKIQPATGGLFSVADVQVHTEGDLRWAQKEYTQEHNGAWTTKVAREGTSVDLGWSEGPEDGTIVWPFEIVVEAEFSGINSIDETAIERVESYLETITQAAVERELMYGEARTGGTAQILDQVNAAGRAALVARPITEAIAALEMPVGIDGNYTPLPRVIHLPPDVAVHARNMLQAPDSEGRVFTRQGTPVVIGHGYENADGPNSAGYTPATRWGYTTGALSVHLSPIDDLEDLLRQAFIPATNRLKFSVTRIAAVSYDPTPETVVKIDLTQ